MSILSTANDYLRMVKNGIKNGDKILEAMRISAQLKNTKVDESGKVVFQGDITEEALAEILKRKEICAVCPFNSRHVKAAGGHTAELPFEHCTLCECRIGYDNSKEYCLTCKCGVDAWNKRNPDKPPMPLKWDSFDLKSKTT